MPAKKARLLHLERSLLDRFLRFSSTEREHPESDGYQSNENKDRLFPLTRGGAYCLVWIVILGTNPLWARIEIIHGILLVWADTWFD